MERMIMHIDINSYFATLLQQENPGLRGSPVGVVKDHGRTCIIAASKEAKKLGISTGCSVKEAKKLSKNIILVPAHFGMMLSATKKLKRIFSQWSPSVDIFSLDEAFLDCTGCEGIVGSDIASYARRIQRHIALELGEWVTCNAGISSNKLLAKMAGEIAPKGSVMIIDGQNLDSVLARVSWKDVCGVGHALAKKLTHLGLFHPYDLHLIDDVTLREYFGPFWSKELRCISLGQETHFFSRPKSVSYQKSVGRTKTGFSLCNEREPIARMLRFLVEEVSYKLRKMDLLGKKISVSLSGNSRQWSQSMTSSFWVRNSSDIWDIVYTKFFSQWKGEFPVIRYGVWIGECVPASSTQLSLFPADRKKENVTQVVDAINEKFGRFCIYPARLFGPEKVHPEVTGYLGDKIYLGL